MGIMVATRSYYLLCFVLFAFGCSGTDQDFYGGLYDPVLLNHVKIPKFSSLFTDTSQNADHQQFFCRSKSCSIATNPCSKIVPRLDWSARAAREENYMVNPVSIVFIHHTVMDRCYHPGYCQKAVLKVQDLHMKGFGWADIGYSFLVGEDGHSYEARGYDRVGAHTLGWNNASIAIGVMGNFSDALPNGPALEAINNVIDCGIALGKIKPDYKLYGHCDARPKFESPGKKFYRLIKTWPNYGHKMLLPTR